MFGRRALLGNALLLAACMGITFFTQHMFARDGHDRDSFWISEWAYLPLPLLAVVGNLALHSGGWARRVGVSVFWGLLDVVGWALFFLIRAWVLGIGAFA